MTLVFLWAVFCAVRAINLTTKRRNLVEWIQEVRSREHEESVEAARRQHDAEENARRIEVEGHNSAAEMIRTAEQRSDPEPLAALLEVELSNEDLPLPLDFDVAFLSVHDVAVEMSLPALDLVPAVKTRLTKTGKLSTREMPERDRRAIYVDLCTGLALLIVHETFRVLPMTNTVEVQGMAQRADPATGQPSTFMALSVRTTRDRFSLLNLEHLDASAAFEALDGRFACDRRGLLSPLRLASVQ